MKKIIVLMMIIMMTMGCASVKYNDPTNDKQITLNTFMKEVSVDKITTPNGTVMVDKFQSKSVTEWLKSLIDGISDTARGILGVRGNDTPININIPNQVQDNE